MERKLAVIGVGNMAKSIIAGIMTAKVPVSAFYLFDTNIHTFESMQMSDSFYISSDIANAVTNADCVLLSVKPQNYPEVLEEIKNAEGYKDKLYVSIAAGISSKDVSSALGNATVIRVLPNLPMTIGQGVSVICRNDKASKEDFDFAVSVFESAGSSLLIDEKDMNAFIGVTSSSPAYVFAFIDAICQGAMAQGLSNEQLLSAVCDMVIGSAMLLKESSCSPSDLIAKVASKGGTTERAISKLEDNDFSGIIKEAMIACTNRADELGANAKK